jgi:DNA-binding NarL/FixJ family response regulator
MLEMCLSIKEHEKILDIINMLYNPQDNKKILQQAGSSLLELLDADCFDLVVKNKQLDRNIIRKKRYLISEDYSEIMQSHAKISSQNPYISFSVKNKQKKIGELKISRANGSYNFTKKDYYLFEKIKPHLCNAINNIYQEEQNSNKNNTLPDLNLKYLAKTYKLTLREAQVTLEILQGKQDEIIAKKLNIAFSTLRTHLKNIFSKLQVNSRTLLLNRIYLDVLPLSQSA